MRLSLTVLPAVVAVLTLVACGSSGTRTVVVTRTTTGVPTTSGKFTGTFSSPVTTPAPTPTTTTGSTTPPGRPKASAVAKAAELKALTAKAKATVHLSTFRSPTGNIGCVILGGTARCDISARSWKPPPRPASCSREVDYGQGLEVSSSGRGAFVCAGDTALDPKGTPLGYGDLSVEGDFACASGFAGLACTNLADGHGFFISRQTYRTF